MGAIMAMSWQTWFFTNFGKFTNHTFRPWQAGLAFFLHLASLVLFLRVGRRMFRANSNDVSIMMKLFVAVWIIENLLALPYAFFIAAFWRPVELDYYWDTSEFIVYPERAFSCTIAIVVFFLTLDRSITLSLGLKYRVKHGKTLCAVCCILIALAASIALFFCVYPKFFPDDVEEDIVTNTCWVFSYDNDRNVATSAWCVFQQPDDWQFVVRIFFGILNVGCSLFFMYILHRHHAQRAGFSSDNSLKNSANNFIKYAVISEIVLNFIPHGSCIIFEIVVGAHISGVFGTWSRLVTSVDALLCALMYYRRIRKSKTPSPSVYTQTAKTALTRSTTTTTRVIPIRNSHSVA